MMLVCREHESFDLYSVRIPEANESSLPISFTDNHVENKGLGMATFAECLQALSIIFTTHACGFN